MITFANIGLPVFIAIFAAALIGAFIWEYCVLRKACKRRRMLRRLPRAPLRKRLSAQCREIFGTPWAIPGDGEPLSEEEMRAFAGYVIAEKDPGVPEPDNRRRQR